MACTNGDMLKMIDDIVDSNFELDVGDDDDVEGVV